MSLKGIYFVEGFLRGGNRARTETAHQSALVMCDNMSNLIGPSCKPLNIVFARRTFIPVCNSVGIRRKFGFVFRRILEASFNRIHGGNAITRVNYWNDVVEIPLSAGSVL
jgi:hypothetical protein